MDTLTRNALPLRHTAWRSAVEHRSLAVLLGAALPVEIAAAANLVLRVSSVDSTGGGALGVGGAFAAMSLAFAITVIPAGVLVDRTPARRTFAVALALRALPMLIGGVLALNGGLTTGAVVVLAAADGLTMALLRPSWQHFQASLVSATAVRDAAILDDWIARAGALLGAVGGGLCAAVGLTGVGLAACATGFVPLLAALALGLGPDCAGQPRESGRSRHCATRGRRCGPSRGCGRRRGPTSCCSSRCQQACWHRRSPWRFRPWLTCG